ncbi:putative integral membrane protein [Acanthocheilonema viteae]
MSPEKANYIKYVLEKTVKEKMEKSNKVNRNYYFYHLFTDRKLGSYAIVFAISLFLTSFINYGIVHNMDALTENVYVNVIIVGAVSYTINIVAAIFEFKIQCVGRRLLHCASAGFIVVVMGTVFVIYLFKWHQIEEYETIVKTGTEGER